MTLNRLAVAAALAAVITSCGGGDSPTAPSNTPPPAPTPTRTITISGDLGFGSVQVGTSVTRSFEIRNTGNQAVTITGMTITSGFGGVYIASWTEGTIQPSATQTVSIRFTPEAQRPYEGTITLAGDFTGGGNTINIGGGGTLTGVPIFTRSGTGNTVIDGMPSYVTRVRVTGRYTRSSSNFVVNVNGRLVVNELLGTAWDMTTYEGTHLLPAGAGTIEITISSGVQWSITEVR